MQILRTMIYLSILVSGCVIFLRLPLASRAVPLLFMLLATVALLVKERVLLGRFRRRAARGRISRAGAAGGRAGRYCGAGGIAQPG